MSKEESNESIAKDRKEKKPHTVNPILIYSWSSLTLFIEAVKQQTLILMNMFRKAKLYYSP